MKKAVGFFMFLAMVAIILLSLTPSPVSGQASTDAPMLPTVGFSSLYEEVSVSLPDIYKGFDFSLPVDLAKAEFSGYYKFNEAQKDMLCKNAFVVVPSDCMEFYQIYDRANYDYLGNNVTAYRAVFVTTDSVFHTYHLFFDKLLRTLERRELAPAIESLTAAMVQQAQTQYAQAKGTSLENATMRLLAYFTIAQQLIEENPPRIDADVADVVNKELALIKAHGGISLSPLFSFEEDYSQYIPRGHYTRSPQLERYFRTMMWYGRINLCLKSLEDTRMALLITWLVRNTAIDGTPALNVWAKVYEPTTFFVGKSDDLGIYEYGPIMDEIYGGSPQLTQFADDSLVHAFIRRVEKMPPPLINSMVIAPGEDEKGATTGFRFMGQRFVLDAYIFENLVMSKVKDRWLPKGLDVFAAMGSEEAYNLLDEMGETKFPNYSEQLEKVRNMIIPLGIEIWTQNLYWDWLYSLQAVVAPKGDVYPPFMRTIFWAHKDLHTALGSWTELKHDTILYAKQVMAEGGEWEEEKPKPSRSYVEPNPGAYARLLALTRMTREGLEQYGILHEEIGYRLADLEDMLGFLKGIADCELAGIAITNDDYDRLQLYGGWLERMALAAADSPEEGNEWGGTYFEGDEQAALVADVASEPGGMQLEEAIGRIFEIYVVVPDGEGGLQVAVGGVYSYYEFPWPMSDRLTDEKWHEMIRDGKLPERPEWTKSFIVE